MVVQFVVYMSPEAHCRLVFGDQLKMFFLFEQNLRCDIKNGATRSPIEAGRAMSLAPASCDPKIYWKLLETLNWMDYRLQ